MILHYSISINENQKKLLSIITVVKNDVTNIELTIKSILSQTQMLNTSSLMENLQMAQIKLLENTKK